MIRLSTAASSLFPGCLPWLSIYQPLNRETLGLNDRGRLTLFTLVIRPADFFQSGVSDGSADYLYLPPVDMSRDASSLTFTSYFTGAYGQTATVLVSVDGGSSFEEVLAVTFVDEELETVNLNVEPYDVYFADGILVHNVHDK